MAVRAVDDQKVVEGVECPAEKTGEHGQYLDRTPRPVYDRVNLAHWTIVSLLDRFTTRSSRRPVRLWMPTCGQICMTPVDKVSEKEKETVEKEEISGTSGSRKISSPKGCKPDLEEIEEDDSVL